MSTINLGDLRVGDKVSIDLVVTEKDLDKIVMALDGDGWRNPSSPTLGIRAAGTSCFGEVRGRMMESSFAVGDKVSAGFLGSGTIIGESLSSIGLRIFSVEIKEQDGGTSFHSIILASGTLKRI